MKTDDEILSLWTGAGGAFAGDPAAQTAMMPREQLVTFLRSLIDGGAKAPVDVLRDPSLVTDKMLICEVIERNLEDEFDTSSEVVVAGANNYDEVEAEAMYYAMHRGEMTKVREFICKLAGKIA
jgi:hypothetical protein